MTGHECLVGRLGLERGSDGDLGGVLVDVGRPRHVFLADLGLGNAFLIAAHGSDDTERSRVDL